ncbi:MAG: hypothetical protein Q8904_00465 [Bacteroidota bacterium]|nr:hypothetical protein [Bacteroidota bacterium]
MVPTKEIIQIFKRQLIPISLYLFVNGLFVFKYFSRAGVDPLVSLSIYIVSILIALFSFYSLADKISEKTYKVTYWSILIVMVLIIIGALVFIDPYSIRVDRWSALSFFWDNFLQGKYPYSAHTHVSLTNYPSPFPLWHAINFPFYLMGDVGIGLIFFLILTVYFVRYFFSSYRKSILFIIMLCFSPAYWWEVAVRSDALNNAFLVFILILWLTKSGRSISNSFFLIAIVCGLISSTRLTAIIPLALYFFKPYLQLPCKQKIVFLTVVLATFSLVFSPFVFWDTNTWIFFTRNPFMSQADKGNIYIFISMIILGCIMALQWKNIQQFFNITSLFIFIFMLLSQIGLIYADGAKNNLFSDYICDISYFSLLLPYCLVSLENNFTIESKESLLIHN